MSSQNARKDSIFAKGYLPWEDWEAKRQDFDALIKQWRAKDPARLILIRSIEQSAVSMERMMYAQARKIEGLMQYVTVARVFCERSGLSPLAASTLPHWFFLEDGDEQKQRALILARIFDEAFDLKSSYSDQLVSKVKETYPALYDHVIGKVRHSYQYCDIVTSNQCLP